MGRLGLWELAWLEFPDGQFELRKVYTTPFGKKIAEALIYRWVILAPSGEFVGCPVWVRRWKPWKKGE